MRIAPTAAADGYERCPGLRRRSEKALLAVIQQAYVEGVSTRRVDDLILSAARLAGWFRSDGAPAQLIVGSTLA